MSGIDAAQPLLDIAAERVPGATLVAGDLEDPLPFDSGSFDVVTAFNSVQYAADPVAVLVNMRKVTRPGGMIGVVVWGPPAQCESGVLFAQLGPLLPPAPPDAPTAIAWSEDGQLERLAAAAGLEPVAVSDVANPLIYPDLATAVRTQLSSGPARAAINHSGLAATRGALTRAFAGSRKPDAPASHAATVGHQVAAWRYSAGDLGMPTEVSVLTARTRWCRTRGCGGERDGDSGRNRSRYHELGHRGHRGRKARGDP